MWWKNIGNPTRHPAFPQSSKLKPSVSISNAIFFKVVPPRRPHGLYIVDQHSQNYLSTFSRWLALSSLILCIVTKFNLQCPKYTVPPKLTTSSTNSNQISISAPCPSSLYLLVRGPLSRYRQYNSIPGISTSYYSFFKIKTFFLDTKFSFLQGSVPSTPLQSQPCWSTFPELSFNIYKVTGINIIKFWIAKCNTSINVIYIYCQRSLRTPSWLWSILGWSILGYCTWRPFALALLGSGDWCYQTGWGAFQ